MIFGIPEKCTACGACVFSCPKDAISFVFNDYANKYAVVEFKKCINCNLCENVCPEIVKEEKNFPKNVYAAWSLDKKQQFESSSGGIAASSMRFAMENSDFDCYATVWERNNGCFTKKIETDEDFKNAIGSKYIENNLFPAILNIKESLKNGKKIIFIGLPCQAAAVKKLFGIKYRKQLFLIELICHGGVPNQYFDQHLQKIENRKKKNAKKILFRTHALGGYCLSLYKDKQYPKSFYKAKMHSGKDLYYLGFRDNLIFREKCYSCLYADEKRLADITIGDYSGLGELWNYTGSERKVNCLLVNNEYGEKLIAMLKEKKYIAYLERPLAEPYTAKGNPQLRAPNKVSKKRLRFLEYYKTTKNFDYSIKKGLGKIYVLKTRVKFLPQGILLAIMESIPRETKDKIKNWIRKFYAKNSHN